MREITLIGQDTTCYGEEFGLRDGLALLLERLAKIDRSTASVPVPYTSSIQADYRPPAVEGTPQAPARRINFSLTVTRHAWLSRRFVFGNHPIVGNPPRLIQCIQGRQ